MQHKNEHANRDEEVLGEQLDKAASGLPVEAPPGIKETNDTSSTHDLANDLSAKGAIEGNDGVLVLGEQRSFDTDQGDHGREAEEKCAGDGKHNDSKNPRDETDLVCTSLDGMALVSKLVELKQHEYASCEVHADIGHNGLERGGDGKSLPVGLGGDTPPEEAVGGHSDNLVCPRGVYVGEKGSANGSANNS